LHSCTSTTSSTTSRSTSRTTTRRSHEIQAAVDAGLFGSLDVNQGDPHSGWDTDEFLVNLYDAVEIMLVLLRAGGLRSGGLNFDAKLRRSSTDAEDIFIAHISSMDTLARGLVIAQRILQDSDLESLRAARYASFDDGAGARFQRGELGLGDLAALADELGEPEQLSGKQELFESLLNRYLR
jgi:xylose isomerase